MNPSRRNFKNQHSLRYKILLNPIIEWSEEDVWEFLNKVVEVPHCELYDEGYTRIGCIGCPMATTKNQIKQFLRWPHVKEKWIRAIMDVRRESILANTPPLTSDATFKFFTLNGLHPPNRDIKTAIVSWGGATNISKILPPRFPNFASQYERMGTARNRFQQSIQQLQKWILEECSNRAATQRFVDGKFLDSGNGDCSAVVAEYNEEYERQVAEAIFNWWLSKKSFKQWFAETYQQKRLDL